MCMVTHVWVGLKSLLCLPSRAGWPETLSERHQIFTHYTQTSALTDPIRRLASTDCATQFAGKAEQSQVHALLDQLTDSVFHSLESMDIRGLASIVWCMGRAR